MERGLERGWERDWGPTVAGPGLVLPPSWSRSLETVTVTTLPKCRQDGVTEGLVSLDGCNCSARLSRVARPAVVGPCDPSALDSDALGQHAPVPNTHAHVQARASIYSRELTSRRGSGLGHLPPSILQSVTALQVRGQCGTFYHFK